MLQVECKKLNMQKMFNWNGKKLNMQKMFNWNGKKLKIIGNILQ